ncbi:MAG: hypothetical protein WBA31_05725, partial [Candidatus Dormiibacterota bacterium]
AREWLRDGMRSNYRTLLSGWKGPVEVLVAGDDRLLNLGRVEAFCAGRPRTELSIIPAAGHGWDAELIRRQLDVLEGFLVGGVATASVPNQG